MSINYQFLGNWVKRLVSTPHTGGHVPPQTYGGGDVNDCRPVAFLEGKNRIIDRGTAVRSFLSARGILVRKAFSYGRCTPVVKGLPPAGSGR